VIGRLSCPTSAGTKENVFGLSDSSTVWVGEVVGREAIWAFEGLQHEGYQTSVNRTPPSATPLSTAPSLDRLLVLVFQT
jgi:hypothetical protein